MGGLWGWVGGGDETGWGRESQRKSEDIWVYINIFKAV